MEEKDLEFYIGEARRSGLSGASAQRFFEIAGLGSDDMERAMGSLPDPQFYIAPEPQEETEEKETEEKPRVFNPLEEDGVAMFSDDLSMINQELLGKSEEEAVQFLRNKYNRYGFQFDEAVPGFDFVNVTAPNGQRQRFNFKPGLPFDSDPNDITAPSYSYRPDQAQSEASELVAFMNKNMIEDRDKINTLARKYFPDTPEFANDKEAENATKQMEERIKQMEERIDNYQAMKTGELKPESVTAFRDMERDLRNDLIQFQEETEGFNNELGRYAARKSEQGTWVGAAYNELINGLDDIVKGSAGVLGDVIINIEERDPNVRDARQKAMRRDLNSLEAFNEVWGTKATSDEYVQAIYENSLIGGGLLGAIRSIPAFAVPSGRIGSMTALTSQVLSGLDQEMSGPAFEGVTENEKYLLKAPLAIATAALERFGFRNMQKLETLAPRLVARAFRSGGKNLTAKTFAEIVEQDIKSGLARGLLTSGNAFISEFETGAMQEGVGQLMKMAWNASKDSKQFKVADTLGEAFKQIAIAGVQEGIGGFALGAGTTYNMVRYGFSDAQMAQIEMLRHPVNQMLQRRAIANKMATGELTNEEGQRQLDNLDAIADNLQGIPENFDLSTKKQLFRKNQQKSALEKKRQENGGKLSKADSKDLDRINKEIEAIIKKGKRITEEEAVKETLEAIKKEDGGKESVEVEDGDGNQTEVTAEDQTPEDGQVPDITDAVEVPESEQEEEDEANDYDESKEQVVEDDIPADTPDDVDSFEYDTVEVSTESATQEGLSEAGFDTPTASVAGRVMEALQGNNLPTGKVVQHNTEQSLRKLTAELEGQPLTYDDTIFGFVVKNADGTREIHLLSNSALSSMGVDFAPSTMDLITEEIATHFALESLMANDTFRKQLYDRIIELSRSNPRLKAIIDQRLKDYPIGPNVTRAQQEEEIIAGFFVDYVKAPEEYRGIVQRIIDFLNSLFNQQTIKVKKIEDERDLLNFARKVSNLVEGKKTKIDSTAQVESTSQTDGQTTTTFSRSGKKRFNYLEDTVIYYDFNRNAGVALNEWANPRPPVPKKIRVKDFYHFRNWYNKQTSNGVHSGIVTNMYRIDENGNKRVVKPPKPKLGKDGLPVKMPRIPTFGDLKAQRAQEEREQRREYDFQYSALWNELGDMWRNADLHMYTNLSDFIPEGAPYGEKDLEGLIIAKQNIQAVINMELTPEQYKELVGNDFYNLIDKAKYPEFFNMSGLERVTEPSEPGTMYDPNARGLMFAKQRKYRPSTPKTIVPTSTTDEMDSIENMPGVGLVVKYDMAGDVTFTLEFGDMKVEYTTKGGADQLKNLPEELKKAGYSISHATVQQRLNSSDKLKYLYILYTGLDENFQPLGRPMTDEELVEFEMAPVRALQARRELQISRLNKDKASRTEKKKAKDSFEKALAKEMKAAEEAIAQGKEIRDELVRSGGKITVPIHLNKPGSLPGRPDLYKALIDFSARVVEADGDSQFKKDYLDAVNRSLNSKIETTSQVDRLYWERFTAVEGFSGPGWRVNNGKIEITTIDAAKRILEFVGTDPENGVNFQQRVNLFQSLDFYKRTRADISEHFNKLPDMQEDVWKQVIEPHYYENLKDYFGRSDISESGYALKAMEIDLNGVFDEQGNPIYPPKLEGSENFPYFLGGLVRVVTLRQPIILQERVDPSPSAAKELPLTRIKKEQVRLLEEERKQPGKKKRTVEKMIRQYEEAPRESAQAKKTLDRLTERYTFGGVSEKVTLSQAYRDARNGRPGIMASRAAGRVSKTVAETAGSKGVSVDQLLQVAGKASKAEQMILSQLLDKFPNVKFISEDELDMFFESKMLQPLDAERSHANYGLDRLYGRKYVKLNATTVPFVGDDSIYGTPGIFEDHFGYPVHAHIRMFTDPDQPGVLYISELQSDTYQKGLDAAYDGSITDEILIEDASSDELGITVQNLEFLKYIVDNYEQYRTLLVVAAGGAENAMNDKFWDDLLQEAEIVPEGRINDAPNVASLLSNALNNNPSFNVRAFRAVLKYYALSDLKAPINSTDKQIEAIIDETFNKYPFLLEGEKGNLGRFAKDLAITIDYTTMSISSLVMGEDMQYMSQEERTKAYNEVVETVETNRKKKEVKRVEGVSSAKKSWEKQLIRYAIRQAQENGEAVVRFPTEKTAADIQWWDASDEELQEYLSEEFGTDRMAEIPDVYDSEERAKQAPLRKRYRDLPKTLKSIGLESRLVRDEVGNSWYEIDTPPSDQRMIMFSRQSKNNMGDVGGATWEARQRTSTEEWTDLWLTRLQDKYRKVFQIQEDVAKKTAGQVKKDQDFRMAEELMYGKAANDLDNLGKATEAISETLKSNGLTVEDLDQYMYALHVKERNAVIRERTEGANQAGSGQTDEWADKTLAELTPEKRQKLEQSAQIVRDILQDTRNAMVELGLESQETIDAFEEMFENYVPLQGKSVDEDDLGYSPYPNGGTGFSVSGETTKKAKGRFTESTNIVAQAIAQNAAVRIKGRTNEAMNALYKLALNNPNSAVWEVLDKEEHGYKSDDPNIVSVRVNGVQKAIRFKDASYAQALRSMNMPQKNYFVKAMGSINSWLRAAFTSRNPEFILSNFSRDIQSAIFNASAESEIEGGFLNGTGAMKRIFKLVGPSLKTLIRDEVNAKTDPLIMKYYQEFKEDGGKTGWAYQKSLEDIAKELEVDDSGKTGAQKVIGGVKGALEFVEGMNDAFENSIRLSSYIAAREGGVSREKAAQFAKNITVNFNKQGEWGAAVNATYLFFNASVQGTARLGRSLVKLRPPVKADGTRREWYERATTAQKAALGMVIMNGLLTLLNRAASDEDEDGTLFYNKIPDYVKERNIIIMRPDGKNYWKIPMPYGYNIFANIGSTSVEVASGDKQALEGLAFMAMSIVNAFSPISFGQADSLGTQFAKTSIPTAFKPFFEAFAFNETYFGGPVKAEQYPFGTPKPNSSMSFRSPEEIKQFFSWLNEATGGSEDVPGIIDINPDGGWYIFEYFLGGTGRFVTRSIETGRKIVADRTENPIDLDFNDIPFARIVYGEPSKYYDMQLFKDREVEIKQLVAEYKDNRIPDAGDRYKNISPLNDTLKAINKQLKSIRAQKRVARRISNYSERVSKIQQLQEQERKLVMIFNKKYEELRGNN